MGTALFIICRVTFMKLAAGRKRMKFGGAAFDARGINARRLSRGAAAFKPVSSLRAVRNPFACPIPGGFQARSRRAGIHRCKRRISLAGRFRSAAPKAFMHGGQPQIFAGSATLFFPTQSLLGSIAGWRHRLVQLFLFDRSDWKKDRPAITSTSI